MDIPSAKDDHLSVSVVIPSYNSAEWLPSTLEALGAALSRTNWTAEVLVVDDGSTDDTAASLAGLAESFPFDLHVVARENQGVYLAVWEGVKAARYDNILILNSRLLLHTEALAYLEGAIAADPSVQAWNGHVITDPTAPLIGRFWEVPTYVFWGSYLSAPRPTVMTTLNFDKVPKGTGCFLIRKSLLEQAYVETWPAENARFTSDDTKLLRFIVTQSPIRLDPGFSATYRPRTTLRKFLAHSRTRGTLFVDSYAGTTPLRSVVLVLLAVAPPLLALILTAFALQGEWARVWTVLGLAALAVLTPVVIAVLRRCPPRACFSYLLYIIPFGLTFWAGLVRGLIVHRTSFLTPRSAQEKAQA